MFNLDFSVHAFSGGPMGEPHKQLLCALDSDTKNEKFCHLLTLILSRTCMDFFPPWNKIMILGSFIMFLCFLI